MSEFDEICFRKYLKGNIAVFGHQNADPDAICSAHALRELILRLNPSVNVELFLPGGPSQLSERVIDFFGIEISEKSENLNFDLLFVVDTGSLIQLDDWEKFVSNSEAFKIFIDHHVHDPEISDLADIYLIDERATSTSELIYKIYDSYDIKPSVDIARVLLAGISFDSKHFGIGTSDTFRIVSELLAIGGSIPETKRLLSTKMPFSERIARLKASQRMDIHKIGEWVIATSYLSSYQSSAARAFLGLGADLAIVAGRKGDELRASMRSTENFFKSTGINLGYLSRKLGEDFGGSGSGHSGAAGLNAQGDPQKLLLTALNIIEEKLKNNI